MAIGASFLLNSEPLDEGDDFIDDLGLETRGDDLRPGLPLVRQLEEDGVDLGVGDADFSFVGLPGPEAGRGLLLQDPSGNAQVGAQLADLGFVQVSHGIDGAGHVAVDRAVADEELGLVAGPQDEGFLASGEIVEDGHPLSGHLVPLEQAALRRDNGGNRRRPGE